MIQSVFLVYYLFHPPFSSLTHTQHFLAAGPRNMPTTTRSRARTTSKKVSNDDSPSVKAEYAKTMKAVRQSTMRIQFSHSTRGLGGYLASRWETCLPKHKRSASLFLIVVHTLVNEEMKYN